MTIKQIIKLTEQTAWPDDDDDYIDESKLDYDEERKETWEIIWSTVLELINE